MEMMKITRDYKSSVWVHQNFEKGCTWETLCIDEHVWVVGHFFGIGVKTYLHKSSE